MRLTEEPRTVEVLSHGDAIDSINVTEEAHARDSRDLVAIDVEGACTVAGCDDEFMPVAIVPLTVRLEFAQSLFRLDHAVHNVSAFDRKGDFSITSSGFENCASLMPTTNTKSYAN